MSQEYPASVNVHLAIAGLIAPFHQVGLFASRKGPSVSINIKKRTIFLDLKLSHRGFLVWGQHHHSIGLIPRVLSFFEGLSVEVFGRLDDKQVIILGIQG